MDREKVEALFDRIGRFRDRVRETAGPDVQEWTAKTSEGATHRVMLSGVKGFDSVGDDVASALVWLWSLKDRLKKYATSLGRSHDWVDVMVTADPCLSICADLANGEKHDSSYSRGSRSHKFPSLGNLSVSVPGSALHSISIGADWSHTSVADPSQVRFSMPVLDGDGRLIADAFALLERATSRWEELWAEVEQGKRP
jgi:hypothetical protein